MEFIKVRNGYLIKNGNGRIISEKEKLEIENHELVLEDINSSGCVKEITKKISKNKKRIEELSKKDQEEVKKMFKFKSALEKEKMQNEDNEEASKSI